MREILDFPFLNDRNDVSQITQSMTTPVSAIDGKLLAPLPTRDTFRQRYHIFISHAQTEASGDVGTLFFLLEQMGMHGWRDMNQSDLTPAGMRRGVYDSDVFVLFLTNSVLSRSFCLKEITWALEFGKPIIIVIEQEARFWPFDLGRWQRNECRRTHDGGWDVGELQVAYEECPAPVRELIETLAADGSMLPFRRRDFEVEALAREIAVKAGTFRDSVCWGSQLPPPAALINLPSASRRIYFIALHSDLTDAVIEECQASIEAVAETTIWTTDILSANHVLVVLTKGSVDSGTLSAKLLEQAVIAEKNMHYMYIDKEMATPSEAWDFNGFYALHKEAPSLATRSVAAHEALKYRPSQTLRYEHDAMCLQILTRMRGEASEEEEEVEDEGGAASASGEDSAAPTIPTPLGTGDRNRDLASEAEQHLRAAFTSTRSVMLN